MMMMVRFQHFDNFKGMMMTETWPQDKLTDDRLAGRAASSQVRAWTMWTMSSGHEVYDHLAHHEHLLSFHSLSSSL